MLRRPPDGRATLAVAFAAIAPDLIDKPLAWQFGVFTSGYAVAHSVFVAVPLVAAIAVLARRYGRASVGYAFGVGYLSHLVGDIVPAYVRDGEFPLEPVIWPLGERSTSDHSQGFLNRFMELFEPYVTDLGTELVAADPSAYTLVQLGISGVAVALWIADGIPVLSGCYARLKARFVRQSTDRAAD